ncbi:MAG: tRNA pseudouridine(55) synthase TruB [Candidatus Kapaibacterium sp.]|nr:tRNA pseudouridine(55) synthase TruB [Ignavibacteriota bacterium]MCB9220249.1 tRNA pseudouridine(55) synthase TruB [Ignavibacteria bacterium]
MILLIKWIKFKIYWIRIKVIKVLYIKRNTSITRSEIQREAQENGLFLYIDKQQDWTSHDVVAKLRTMLKIKKIGHSGTLDPMATGLLIIAIGRGATKQISELQAMSKSYTATMKIGATTKTDDAEANEENLKDISHINEKEIKNVFLNMQGEIAQIPPMFSAKKVKGQKLYHLARKNIEIELEPSNVFLFENKITNINLPYISFEVKCSKGTYIRAIARDIGNELGVGGYLTQLRRTSIENHRIEDALTLMELQQIIDENESI